MLHSQDSGQVSWSAHVWVSVVFSAVHVGVGFGLFQASTSFFDFLWEWCVIPRGESVLVAAGGLSSGRVFLQGESWRFLSAMLVHGSWLHLWFNASAIGVLGRELETECRSWEWLSLGVSGGLCAGVASAHWGVGGISVGASGGAFALAGVVWIDACAGRLNLCPKRLGLILAASLAAGYVLPFLAWSVRLDQMAHLGGLLFGLIAGVAGVMWGSWWRLAVALSLAGFFWSFSELDLVGRVSAVDVQVALSEIEAADCGAALLRLAGSERDLSDAQLNELAYGLAQQVCELDQALVWSQKSLETRPNDRDFLDTLGWIHCLRGDTEPGVALLSRAAEIGSIPEVDEHLRLCASSGAKFHVKH